jgi:hypothetical protein
MDDIATRKQILLAASCVQSRQFFVSLLREQLFELKNEEVIKKVLRVYATHVLNECYPSTLCKARSNLIRRYLYVLINKCSLTVPKANY